MNDHPGALRVGTSGFSYNHWRGVFYPPEVPQRAWLEFYAERFDTVELNNPFYRLPSEATFRAWHDRAPRGFCYAVKMSRYLTHVRKLNDPAEPIERFLQHAAPLAETLGPILIQLPPGLHADPPRLDAALALCPRQHRWAVEFRHPSWLVEPVYEVLRRHGAALCIHDHIPDHPHVLTAGFTYLRFHGAGQPDGNYTDDALDRAAERIRTDRAAGVDVYAYFNNDWHGYAIGNAQGLRGRLGR